MSRRRPRPIALWRASMLAAATLGLASCGSPGAATLLTAKVARAITATIQRRFGIATTVTCPAHPPERSGYGFECVARLAVGAYIVAVRETNSHGRVSFTGTGPLRSLDIVSIEHAIAAAMGHARRAPASVHCPSPVLQRSGLAFSCTARTRAGTIVRFTVSQDNGKGRVTLASA